MLVIDLFSGLGGWSAAFRDRGHEVFTVDNDPRFEADLCEDMFNVRPCDLPDDPTAILASPPCNRFSVMTIGKSWEAIGVERHPRNEATVMGVGLVAKTLQLIRAIDPPYWVMENPVGMLRKIAGPPRITTYFCAWNPGGVKKPTDLWGVIPKGIVWPKPQKWIKASRGEDAGTQDVIRGWKKTVSWSERENADDDTVCWERGAFGGAEAAKIPYGLSEALCKAVEKELEGQHTEHSPGD